MTSDKEHYAGALNAYFFPPDRGQFTKPLLDVSQSLPSHLKLVAEAFEKNLHAAMTVASVPYEMASIAVRQRLFQAILTAQRIRSLKVGVHDSFSSEEEREEWAYQTAEEQFAKEIEERRNPDDKLGKLTRGVLDELTRLLQTSNLAEPFNELLRQCTVLSWGALEVLATDVFVALLNEDPSKTSNLLDDVRTRKYFDPKAFGSALRERNYNLSHCMGEVLVQQHRIDSVDAIRNIFIVLFPGPECLRTALASDVLWMLGQDRNLIVHRRAVIDEEYVGNTGCKDPIGSALRIHPDLFEKYLMYVRDAGVDLLSAVSA
jgi:hypothetical protein